MNKLPIMPNNILVCDCHANEHHYIIRYLEEQEDIKPLIKREVYISPHLATYRSFFKRIGYAFRYIFGYKARSGAWDEIIINKTNYHKLKTVIDFIEEKVDFEMEIEADN